MLKLKSEIPNYEEKAKFLIENGWETWYNDDNWVKSEWVGSGKPFDTWGRSTDELYNMLTKNNK